MARSTPPRSQNTRATRLRRRFPALDSATRAVRLIVILGLMVLGGTLLLWLPLSGAQRQLGIGEAFFTAVSALATTGLSVITPGSDLSLFGQIVLLLLMQLGGIGFVVVALVANLLLGRRLNLADRLTLRDSLGLLSVGGVLQLTRRVLAGVLLIELVGALLLWLNWWPIFGPGPAAYYALFHTVSAFTNASFDLFSGSPIAPAGFPSDAFSLLVISTLIILGSIGIPVLADLALWPKQRRLSLHTRITLITAATLLLGGTLALFISENREGALFAEQPWPRRLLLAYFHSASARTSGFILQPLATLTPASVLTLTVLMFIGGSPASMGGGITTGTFAVLSLAMWSYVQGRSSVAVGRRTIPSVLVFKATAVLGVSLVLVFVVTWLLLLTHDTDFSTALFETVSAFATCGFTLGLTPDLNPFGRLLIALTMFWGRLGALTIAVAILQPTPPQAVNYPEEQVLIG